MPTSDEIRQNISKSAENFKQTVNSFNGNWTEAPDDENWSAQQVAEHTVKAIIFFARIVSETMQSRPPEKVESEFPTKTDAIAAHESAVSILDRVFRYVEDRDLGKPVDRSDENDWPATIEGAMTRSYTHFDEHAEQINSLK